VPTHPKRVGVEAWSFTNDSLPD